MRNAIPHPSSSRLHLSQLSEPIFAHSEGSSVPFAMMAANALNAHLVVKHYYLEGYY